MPSKRQAPDRAWICGSGRLIWALNDGGGGADQAGAQEVLISGQDLVDAPSIVMGDMPSEFYCERIIFNGILFGAFGQINANCIRLANFMLLTASIADQVSISDNLIGPRADVDMYDTDSVWWTIGSRILQQDTVQVAEHAGMPMAASSASLITSGGSVQTFDLPNFRREWRFDLETRFSLSEDRDLILAGVSAPASVDSEWDNGDTTTLAYTFKSLWRRRRQ